MSSKKMRPLTQKLASMTGYARVTDSIEGANVQCEIKSVNSRGLDIRLRMGAGLDILEARVRRKLADRLVRGAISCSISIQRDVGGKQIVINNQALGTVLDALDALSGKIEADRPRLDGILAIEGVLEKREMPMSSQAEESVHACILSMLDACIDDLVLSRQAEGARLGEMISDRINEMENLAIAARDHPSRRREIFMERISRQIGELSDAGPSLSEERLHQEALILATRADISEELDRLFSHVKTARQLVAGGGPVGRKLDFLAQEFNREANTLCSKSHSVELTQIGLDMKSAIDQLREQVQNIE